MGTDLEGLEGTCLGNGGLVLSGFCLLMSVAKAGQMFGIPGFHRTSSLQIDIHKVTLMKETEDELPGTMHSKDPSLVEGSNILVAHR